ncbi:MAG: lipopolysaccharide heptosyltransferase II [Pyrinomonadaceae bacterium]|nr:lipopolysaccharide heptosyltransferase II [Pyrinomonadaceae bacterium]
MKILVRGTNWIGDAVMSIPALRELRRSFPEAHITLHTRAWAEGIFRDAEYIDDILAFEESGSNFRTMLRQAKELRKRRFDLAVLFPNSYRSAAIVRLAGIPRRFGYSKEGRGMLLTDALRVPEWKDKRHEVYYYLNIVEAVKAAYGVSGGEAIEPELSLGVSDARIEEARSLFSSFGLRGEGPLIALGPGSTNSMAKRWPAERFAQLADALVNDTGASVAVLGSKQETDVAAEVAAHANAPIIDLAGKTDLAQVTAILKMADLFVSNDMGLAHIAAAVGTPTIVIFGPTNPVTTRPFSPTSLVMREPVECSPCMLRECPIDHRCMTRVSVESVLENAIKILNSRTS